ncbi:MAG: hypothetical protein HZB91_07030 [Elusimicrobia bacterium]|nr:hypothetical protein [Elusimicrobiota bacterium]
MPETTMKPSRKHGQGSKISSTASRVSSRLASPIQSPVPMSSGRIQTSVTLVAHRQAYHWFTDRGRSRVLVKF